MGGSTPRDFRPCGDVLDCGRPLVRGCYGHDSYQSSEMSLVATCEIVVCNRRVSVVTIAFSD